MVADSLATASSEWRVCALNEGNYKQGEKPSEWEKIIANKTTDKELISKSLQIINAGEGVEIREPSYTVGGNAN